MADADPPLDDARAALQTAQVVALPTRKPEAGGDGRGRGKARGKRGDGGQDGGGVPHRRNGLPPGCPVTPLGKAKGTFYYLDTTGELRDLKAKDHGNKDLLALFAPRTDFLHSNWPRMNAKGIVSGWRPEEAGEELMTACAIAGVWNQMDRVRGRGAWRDAAGGLILHCGDAIWLEGEWHDPGLHQEHVYPSGAALPRPLEGPAPARMMDELLELLGSWRWQRQAVDPVLMLGWLAAAKIGGALAWRPLAWISGDKGTGKSTLQRLIAGVLGGALLQCSDATEAGVRQTLGDQTLPVALDEVEAEDDNRKLAAVIKLARQAASGGKIVRGSSDHTAQEFVARSGFLFSSILMPPLKDQDKSRMAVLNLEPLEQGAPVPKLTAEWLRSICAVMARRLVDGFPRFETTLDIYRQMLEQLGHSARGADQFGVLLAAADLVLNDTAPSLAEALAEYGEVMSASALAETASETTDAARCLQHLRTSMVTLDGGGRPQTIGAWIERTIGEMDDQALEKKDAGARGLAVYGLRVVDRRDGTRWLGVATSHQGLGRLYAGSHWQAASGTDGVWAQALGRIKGALRDQPVRIDGKTTKCVLLPIAAVRDEEEV